MAVSLNAAMAAGNQDSNRTYAVAGTITSFSTTGITVAAGVNRALVAIVGWHGGNTDTPTSRSVTWNSVLMTEAAFQSSVLGAVSRHIGIYVLPNPDTGALALAGAWTTAFGDVYVSAVAFDGADQTTVVNAGDTAANTTTSVATTGSADGATLGASIESSACSSVSGKTIFSNYDGGQPGMTGAYEIGGTGTQTYDFSTGSGTPRSAAAIHVLVASAAVNLATQRRFGLCDALSNVEIGRGSGRVFRKSARGLLVPAWSM